MPIEIEMVFPLQRCTLRPCFTSFCFNTPCQFTPLCNLCSLIFSLSPFGWFICMCMNFSSACSCHDDAPNWGTKRLTQVNDCSSNFNGSNMFDLWVIKWLCESEFDNVTKHVWRWYKQPTISDMPNICKLGWYRKLKKQIRQPLA